MLLDHLLLLFDFTDASNCNFVGRERRTVGFLFQPLIDHFDDSCDLLFAVGVEKLAVAPLALLHLLQVFQGVLVAVVGVFFDVTQLQN
jgi:hypothetical protein